jgi:FAD/FMN-containing dehydrogenase
MRSPLSRRELLQRGGKAAALLGAGALAGGGAERARASTLRGDVVVPGERGYAQARLLFNPRFDRARPRAIVYCRTPGDVTATVDYAREHGIAIAARSGGHSFGGYSAPTGGIVADVSRMRSIRVDRSSGTAVLGPGVVNLGMDTGLGRQGLAVPGGTCPTVGIGGLTMGGGFGYSSRSFGLIADNLLELELVTAAGRRVRCSATEHPDLFWACRGGGGGNFGIATAFRFRVRPAPDVAIYQLAWRWSDAAAVLDAWQHWAPDAPDELFSTCGISRSGSTAPAVASQGQFFGSPERLSELLQPLLAAAPPTQQRIAPVSFVAAQRLWAACRPEHCDERAPNPYAVKTDFLDAPMPAAGIAAMIDGLERWPGSAATGPPTGIEWNSWGGAINRVPSDATAFVHRDARVLAIYGATWSRRDSSARIAAIRAWQQRLYAAMRPYASGFAYQNLIDPTLRDWRHAYYGANLPRLVAVKRRWDPHGVFDFAQGL